MSLRFLLIFRNCTGPQKPLSHIQHRRLAFGRIIVALFMKLSSSYLIIVAPATIPVKPSTNCTSMSASSFSGDEEISTSFKLRNLVFHSCTASLLPSLIPQGHHWCYHYHYHLLCLHSLHHPLHVHRILLLLLS